MESLYLDHNATSPLLPEVAEAMAACQQTAWANPASQHTPGRQARRVLEEARETIASLLGADLTGRSPDRILFTSGGTEANNLALAGLGASRAGQTIVSAVEHPSVMAPAQHLAARGQPLAICRVDRQGIIDRGHLDALLAQPTRLTSVMLANNETGVLQDLAAIAEQAHRAGSLVHTDASQAVGRIDVNFRALGVDALSLSAHKLHGPVGIGALVVGAGIELTPQLLGGHQQQGLRGGTESVALVVGLQAALECWHRQRDDRSKRWRELQSQFEHVLLAACPELVIHGAEVPRLPQTSAVGFPGVNRQALFMRLDLEGVICSTGSACQSGSSEPSNVLVAMGLEKELIDGSLRFSWGARTTALQMAQAAERILRAYKALRDATKLRKIAPADTGGSPVSL